jgi:hypothetical protein
MPDRSVVDEVARREVVRAVDDHVPALVEDPIDVLGGQALAVRDHADVRVERLNGRLRGVDLRRPERLRRVHDLALQVGLVDHVSVDDAQRADPRRGEVQRRGRTEAAGADEQHARVEQPHLALLADLRDQQVAAVAGALRRVERAGQLDGESVALPVREAAGERARVGVAQLLQGLRAEDRAVADGAVDHDRSAVIRDESLDPRLEVAARDVQRARDVALVPLVTLADVEEERVVGAPCRARSVLLDDLLAGARE